MYDSEAEVQDAVQNYQFGARATMGDKFAKFTFFCCAACFLYV